MYDTSHQFYKNVVKKAEAWKVIAEELDITSYADTFRKFQPATQAMMNMELATLFARTEMRELGTPMGS